MKIKLITLTILLVLLTLSAGAAFDGYILAFKNDAARDAAFVSLDETDGETPSEISVAHLLYKTYDEALAKSLDADGYLAYYEENTLLTDEPPKTLFTVPNMADLLAVNYQWSHDLCRTKLAWKLGVTGRGTTGMVIDSGVVYTHEDLADTVVGGYDYVNNKEIYTPNPSFPVSNMAYYHGTMVSGFAAANHNNIGVTGVAHEGKIYMARCISNSGGIPMDKAAIAIMEASSLGISAINMSFGTKDTSNTMNLAVSLATDDGVILCAAAGNTYGGTEIQYPASCTGAISVAACGSGGSASGYTSNSYITITAPGVSVRSTHANGGYSSGSGTSYASPYVMGAALLAKSIDEELTPEHFREVMIATANKTCLNGAARNDAFGYGILDVGALITALLDEKYDTLYVGPLFHDFERESGHEEDGIDTYTVLNATKETKDFIFRAYALGKDGETLDEKLAHVVLGPGKTSEIDVTSLCALPHERIGYEILDTPSVFMTTPARAENNFEIMLFNSTDTSYDVTLITALYDENGRLLAASSNDVSMSDGFVPVSIMNLPTETVLICGKTEGENGHKHDKTCYQEVLITAAKRIKCFLLENGSPICDAVMTRLAA